ncbi:FMR1-interacting protein NUFIP2-like [Ambystoma mexicanum]|uniref:FMR1-interacting protein NUFIP2-like n=1 Tax=Ambystoma mexicanum TaxID=8296 RepID=UPI0037E8DBCF
MQKENIARDENRNPKEILPNRKDKLSSGELEMNQINSRIGNKSGSWDTNGHKADLEIEAMPSRSEDSVPLSPSNSLNIHHVRGSDREHGPRSQRPATHYYNQHHQYHNQHHQYQYQNPQYYYSDRPRPFYPGYRKNYRDYDRNKFVRDGNKRPERKEWAPRPGGAVNGYGPHPSGEHKNYRARSTESLASLEEGKGTPPPTQEGERPPSADYNRPFRSGTVKPNGRYATASPAPPVEQLQTADESKVPATAKKEELAKGRPPGTAEDTWSLFKPLPVFPVDNSSARTQPKISYASKVKENLERRRQEPLASQQGKPTQVPASAVRTTSSLPNCVLSSSPTSQQNGAVPLGASEVFHCAVATTVSSAPNRTEEPALLHSNSSSSFSSSAASSSSSPSPSPCQENGHSAGQSQEQLGAIFQNEWGLSFINDPGQDAATVPATNADPGGSPLVEVHCQEEVVPADVQDCGADTGKQSELAQHGFFVEMAVPQENGHQGFWDMDTKEWEATVHYHTQEWEYIWKLHKQDPTRVVVYSESMDGKG